MPCTPKAADFLKKASVLIAPAMAVGTGGLLWFYLLYVFSMVLSTI
ncbi:hypothetical protein Ahy_A06g027476 isoform B [Arachis hypogaea]|uniref:Uncharacterized protein n=1 Tax=Arachis hypogaea TaxID=3818 RepID=A0A445CNU5_ARAHY|nr:hypothetical protein Ahy_A06g027476 isoform B [Arachis hypogaea]